MTIGAEFEVQPEPSRGRSTLKVLGTVLLVVAIVLVTLVTCVRAYVGSVPEREVTVPRAELAINVPRFIPVTSFGADGTSTHGVWVTLRADGTALAFSSRGPERGCFVAYRPEQSAFRDGCTQTLFAPDGAALTGPTRRGLDQFTARVTPTAVEVNLERTQLGLCRDAAAGECSRPGSPAYRATPK